MKDFSIVVFICFLIWQTNSIVQISHARAKLNNCINSTIDNYSVQWDDICKSNGKKENCKLNGFQYSGIEAIKDKQINYCIEIFKTNK